MSDTTGARIHVTGVVQGVGFRPFVYSLAQRMQLVGWVRNTSSGVDIAVDGSPAALEAFVRALRTEAPPLAHIDGLHVSPSPPDGFSRFEILDSQPESGAFQPVSPDMAVCADCLRELFDPNDRRYRYPFINCTNCGPRYTIIRDIPYDRPLTTMASFAMCPQCAAEYHDPADRRFHAQPVACLVCGPHVVLEENGAPEERINDETSLQRARALLRQGRILAVKGLGGFHLACDATDAVAVAELRRRKLRVDKPFAVMMPDLAAVHRHCLVRPAEEELLLSRARPIVILPRRSDSPIAAQVAPGQAHLGVVLPYTPLHYLLLERAPDFPDALVMTSGNLSEEPIAYRNAQARERLAALADAFLLHDRDIHVRCDDSVVRLPEDTDKPIPLRRSRGYAPFPVRVPWEGPPLLAAGAELKNAFCLVRDDYAFLSHHIGDMENYETLVSFEEGVRHLERLFRIQPEIIAYDLHPDYLATRYALERAERDGLPAVGVQHHHAHIAAGMAEHRLKGDYPVIGVAFDGTGYGDDSAVWGGEFLIADYAGYQRAAHLRYAPLPGGDQAAREPWRMALAWLHVVGLPWDSDLPPVRQAQGLGEQRLSALRRQLERGLNAPPTSSMGRLFDAVAALLDLRQVVNYEAQAAVELEALVDSQEKGVYPFDLSGGIVDPRPMWEQLIVDRRAGISTGRIAARFHNGVAQMVLDVCRELRRDAGAAEVVLSGGVWQNMILLQRTLSLLRADDFVVLIHHQVPTNDGGLALGQAAVAGFWGRSWQ